MKKFFVSAVIFILIFSGFNLQKGVAAKQVFSDVPTNHAYFQEINFLLEKGVISPASKYGVNDKVTREEVAVMVSKAVGLDGKQAATKFPDVPASHPSSGYIKSAVKEGIINGYLDGTFKPNEKVTRGHMAAFIARGFKLTQEANITFKDVPKGSTSYEAVRKLAYKNITTGYEDGTFKPNETLSRAHISAFIARAMGFKKDTIVNQSKDMKVHFIDVGQGDAILIQSPNSKNMLIDGGTRGAGNKVVAYLRDNGVKQLDYVVATHPDADHIGGLISVLNSISIKNFVDSGKVHTSQTYFDMLTLVDTKNINFIVPKEGDKISLDPDLSISVLNAGEGAADNNEASIVLSVTYGSVSFLLTGDADSGIENDMMAKHNVKATVLKAGHHGSNTSSSAAFVNTVKPVLTILSYGKENSYSHPHAAVVSRLQKAGSKIYSTAESGDIVVTTNGKTHSVSVKPWSGVITPAPIPNPEVKPQPKPEQDLGSGLYVVPGAPQSFANCTEMRKYYPNGVKTGHPAYASKHDRDKDGWACE